jgi:hypothetical protein
MLILLLLIFRDAFVAQYVVKILSVKCVRRVLLLGQFLILLLGQFLRFIKAFRSVMMLFLSMMLLWILLLRVQLELFLLAIVFSNGLDVL